MVYGPAMKRRILHLGSTVVPVAYAVGVPRGVVIASLGAAVVVAAVVERLRRSSSAVQGAFERVVGSLLRDHEHEGITAATWLAVSMCTAVVVLPSPAAVAALWCVSAGDPAAAAAGTMWQRRRGGLVRGERTVAGFAALFCVSALGVHLVAGYSVAGAVAVGMVAAAAERLSGRINDNVTIVLGAGVAALAVS